MNLNCDFEFIRRLFSAFLCFAAAWGILPRSSSAAHLPLPGDPVYFRALGDAVTGDLAPLRSGPALGNGGQFTSSDGSTIQWDIDQFNPDGSRADSYLASQFERPTDQTYTAVTSLAGETRFGLGNPGAGSQYYGYLDIVQAQVGFDDHWLYVGIDLFSLSRVSNSGSINTPGLEDFYRFRIGTGPTGAESRNGFLVSIQNPTANSATTFTVDDKAEVFADQSSGQAGVNPGDVGGVSILPVVGATKEGSIAEAAGNGYDVQVVSDGRTNGSGGYSSGVDVLYTRINPSDPTIVEFAWDYNFFGFSAADLASPDLFLMIEATKGLTGPSNYFWNDEYNFSEAGTPNFDERGLLGPSSAFPLDGLKNIYQLDTVRINGGLVPEPSSWALLALGMVSWCGMVWRRRTRRLWA